MNSEKGNRRTRERQEKDKTRTREGHERTWKDNE